MRCGRGCRQGAGTRVRRAAALEQSVDPVEQAQVVGHAGEVVLSPQQVAVALHGRGQGPAHR